MINNTLQAGVGGMQNLSLEEIDAVSGGITVTPGVAYAIRVGLALTAVSGVGALIGFGAAGAIYYFNQP